MRLLLVVLLAGCGMLPEVPSPTPGAVPAKAEVLPLEIQFPLEDCDKQGVSVMELTCAQGKFFRVHLDPQGAASADAPAGECALVLKDRRNNKIPVAEPVLPGHSYDCDLLEDRSILCTQR